jgi:hypothetical protein
MSNVYLAYSPNDFFYVDVSNINIEGIEVNHLKPSDEECSSILTSQSSWTNMFKKGNLTILNKNGNPDISGSSILSWEISCNFFFGDNSLNCIKYQLCKNKTHANTINTLDEKHTSDFAKDLDSNDNFKKIFLNTINLTIGVLFLLIVITKVFTKK